MLTELDIAHKDGSIRKVLKAYKTISLLILDEWLLSPLRESESKDLLEIAEARYKKGSTIFALNLMSAVGTRKSMTQLSPMPFTTASFTMHTASSLRAMNLCENVKV